MLPIAGQTPGPLGLNFFCEHSWVAGGCYRLKNSLIIYIIKQDIHIYIYDPFGWPNCWTECADIYCAHSWVVW